MKKLFSNADVSNWYRDRYNGSKGDTDSARVGFDVPERQALRWEILVQAQENIKTLSILDAGCGLAGLLDYIRKNHNFQGSYTGIDFLDEYVDECKRKHSSTAEFLTGDIYTIHPPHTYDLIVGSGIFTLAIENQWEVFQRFMTNMYHALNVGGALALNFFPTYVNYQDPEFAYFEPEKAYAMAKALTPYVTLRSDYLPFDATLYLYKKAID